MMINLNIVMPVELITLINIVKHAEMHIIFVNLNAIEEFYMKVKKDC